MVVILPILFVSCQRNEKSIDVAMKVHEGEHEERVSDFGPLEKGMLYESQYRPNMVVRYRLNGLTYAAVKLKNFKDCFVNNRLPRMKDTTCPFFYARNTILNSENIKVNIKNSDLRSTYGLLVSGEVKTQVWEIDPENMTNVLPGDGIVGKLVSVPNGMSTVDYDNDVVSFRVDMFETFNSISNKIHLKKDGRYKVSFKVPPHEISEGSAESVSPDTLSMWHFDETNGRWTFETYAFRKENEYEAELNKFGWWTSLPYDCEFKEISFNIKDDRFYPIPYSDLEITSEMTNQSYHISTDMYGECCVWLRQDDSYKVKLKGFSVPTFEKTWPFKESYTNIELSDENYEEDIDCSTICDIRHGVYSDKYPFVKGVVALYRKHNLDYNALPQHQKISEDSKEDSKKDAYAVTERIEMDRDERSYYDMEDPEMKKTPTYAEFIPSASKSHAQYPMPYFSVKSQDASGEIKYGEIKYGQTFMSRWDTLSNVRINGKDELYIVSYPTKDSLVAKFSGEIEKINVGTIKEGENTLYILNSIHVDGEKRIKIKYSTANAYDKTKEDRNRHGGSFKRFSENYKKYKHDYEFYTDKFTTVPSFRSRYFFRNDKEGRDLCLSREIIQIYDNAINTNYPIWLKVYFGEKQLRLLSVKDKYDNNVLLNPKLGIINPKAFKSNKLTYEFGGDDYMYGSTIRDVKLSSKNFVEVKENHTKQLIVSVLIVLLMLYAAKEYGREAYEKFKNDKYRWNRKTSDSKDVSVHSQDEKEDKNDYERNVPRLHSDMAHLIANVVNLGPSFDERHVQMLHLFQSFAKIKCDLPLMVSIFRVKLFDLDDVMQSINTLSNSRKKALIQLLYKIAITDDGISDDEWNFLDKVMIGMKLNQSLITKLHRRYGPLRSDKKTEANSSKKSSDDSEKSNKKKHTGDNSKRKTYYSTNSTAFSVLGIPVDSTREEVVSAYRMLAKTWHPDLPKNANNLDECVRKMAEINVAYAEMLKKFG